MNALGRSVALIGLASTAGLASALLIFGPREPDEGDMFAALDDAMRREAMRAEAEGGAMGAALRYEAPATLIVEAAGARTELRLEAIEKIECQPRRDARGFDCAYIISGVSRCDGPLCEAMGGEGARAAPEHGSALFAEENGAWRAEPVDLLAGASF